MATKPSKRKQVCKIRKIIESFYKNHFTLLCYLRKQCKAIRLIQDGDSKEYRALLKSTLVAVPRDQSATPPFNPTNTHWFTLKEIIIRVIENICRSNKTNVLAQGFERRNGHGKKGTVAGTSGIQNSYPNTIVSYLQTTSAWQVLHERIGDDLMIHLLQNMSLFVKVNNKCYFQLAGHPISRLSLLSATDVSPQHNNKQQIPQVGEEDRKNAVLKRKIRRGGKRAKRFREKSNQGEKENLSSGSDVAVKDSSAVVSCKPAEMDKDSLDLDESTDISQIGKRKRRLESNEEQQPSAKKARTADSDDGVPSSYLVETSEDDQRNTPKCGTEKSPTEVSPLLFSDDSSQSSERSSEESTPFCNRPRNSESGTCDRVVTALFQEGTEADNVSECSAKEEIRTVMPEEQKAQSVLKRKNPVSSTSGVGKKEAKKRDVKRKPWEYLVKCLPKSGKSSSKAKQKNTQQPSNNRSRPVAMIKKRISINEVTLPRSSLFYSSNVSQTFPKNHVMETSTVSMTGARRLAQQIFLQDSCLPASRNSSGSVKNVTAASTSVLRTGTPAPKKQKPVRFSKKLKRVLPLLLKFLARHKKCPFRTLLRHHCYYTEKRAKKSKKMRTLQRIPLRVKMTYHKRAFKSGEKPSKKKATQVDALTYRRAVKNYTKHDQVVRFLECVCHKVIPNELWGSSENKAMFLRNLGKFIRLHRAETFTLAQLMSGIKVSSCEWLSPKESEKRHVPPSDSLKQQDLLAQFIWWFVTQYLMLVLKTFFYITESGTHRQRVFYYRKPVWKKIHQFGLSAFCGEFFKPLKTTEAEELLRRPSSLGFSLLRFIPKSSTVRPITNMRHCPTKKEQSASQKQQSVNTKLQNLFEVLKFEKQQNPKNLGATLFGADDFYQALKPFVARVRTDLKERPLYFVHVDVSHCYESILHHKLYDVIQDVLQDEEYLIRRFSLLRMSAGKVFREFLKHVSTADDCRKFPDFFRHLVAAWKLKQVIAVDNVWYVTEERDKLVNILGEQIFNNIVKIGNSYYQQERGIAQGSILSTMLCGFYYSQMERTHLSEVSQDPDSLLLRWVDDFLLITPQKNLADKFLNVMHAGIPEYGCVINKDKTVTNYDAVTADGKEVKRVRAGERFPWCGFLLDTVALEVSPDLSRYIGLLLRDTLTISLNAHPGESLSRKLKFSVRPKCHPLLLDPNLNTRQSILLNVYQVFLLTAYKFHAYAKELPRGGQPKDNPRFFCGLILDLAQYFHSASSRKCRQLTPRENTFSLNEHEVTWLCFHAFQACLRKKQSRYKEVLRFLRKGLSQLRLPAEDCKIVMDSSQHAVFKHIR